MVLLNLLTFGLWGKVGKVAHYAFDALLISTFLAGMRRSTGLTPGGDKLKTHWLTYHIRSFKKETITESKDINVWIEKYLGVGEWVMDSSVAFAGSSRFFERKR
ncbi:Uncharacterized protein LHYA1_G005300 [Lachnellula hyalina]|uniref:DUF1748-domain-containing protein n=1 Tax=Lachnellula hyalina TaxID=1316788 RepID=A0A8H8R5C9_9HELO|nr:Uncharacterized protein LHYA1_G005300 [Lachnellula hyalina]TVY27154.1 Uncharacterized protein LHYA1_G005300 [Lachnellula hyalina]